MVAYITRGLRLSVRLGGIKKELRKSLGELQCCLRGRDHVHYHKMKRLVQ